LRTSHGPVNTGSFASSPPPPPESSPPPSP
jgi:hypothetical protein